MMNTKTTPTPAAKSMQSLTDLRNTIRAQIHLAEADLRSKWSKLEPQVNTLLQEAGAATRRVADELTERVKQFSLELEKGLKGIAPAPPRKRKTRAKTTHAKPGAPTP